MTQWSSGKMLHFEVLYKISTSGQAKKYYHVQKNIFGITMDTVVPPRHIYNYGTVGALRPNTFGILIVKKSLDVEWLRLDSNME